jgi:hypothetical protein
MISLRKLVSRTLVASALTLAAAAMFVPTDASASVSIAVPYEALVKDADAIAVVSAGDASAVWEDGRIYTYTKFKVEQGVGGELATGNEGFVRTMGGVVGKIGQMVDGEAVLSKEGQSLLFLRRFNMKGVYEVSARAQGHYPVTIDDATKLKGIVRSGSVGLLLPPKAASSAPATPAAATAAPIRLAQDVLHGRAFDDATRDLSDTWKRLHPAPAK